MLKALLTITPIAAVTYQKQLPYCFFGNNPEGSGMWARERKRNPTRVRLVEDPNLRGGKARPERVLYELVFSLTLIKQGWELKSCQSSL
ncbi:uncharacterized protein [Physcomitrium patens]|uniref:uncharacterized protein isoform X2 n=1 Tax=Physcomitrium patens TaxID=3218 RepID=UPI003CCCAB25